MRFKPDSGDLLRAQQALHESEARRQSLLDFALDCVICADAGGKITDFNPAAERTFRVARSEAVGKDVVQTILPPGSQDRLRRDFFTAVAPGSVDIIGNRIETGCLRADGSEFPAELTVTQIVIEKQTSYTVYVRDITARRRAEEIVVRLAAIVESSQDAIIGKDLNCRITSWNRGAELMYGYSASEAIGQHISVLAPAGRSHEIQKIIEELETGRPIENFETIRMAKNGRLIHVSLTVSPVLDSDRTLIGASSIARDITAQKLAEEALRRASETSIYASPVPIIAVDTESRVTMWNPAAESANLFLLFRTIYGQKPPPCTPGCCRAKPCEESKCFAGGGTAHWLRSASPRLQSETRVAGLREFSDSWRTSQSKSARKKPCGRRKKSIGQSLKTLSRVSIKRLRMASTFPPIPPSPVCSVLIHRKS